MRYKGDSKRFNRRRKYKNAPPEKTFRDKIYRDKKKLQEADAASLPLDSSLNSSSVAPIDCDCSI